MIKMADTNIEDQPAKEQQPFPWELGVFDAHCHPTDTMTSISEIPHMHAAALTVMSTRGEDQELVEEVTKRLGIYTRTRNTKIVPCFGWHPWFAHRISIENNETPETAADLSKNIKHYQTVLNSGPTENDAFYKTLPTPKSLLVLLAETRERLLAYPNALVGEIGLDKAFRLPLPWQAEEIESRNAELTPGSREGRRLSPYKVTMAHQKALFKAQLQLAGQLRRAVSVHSVQAHGAVLEVFQELWTGHERKLESKRQRKLRHRQEQNEFPDDESNSNNNEEGQQAKKKESRNVRPHEDDVVATEPLPYPPRICMHSYSGPPEALKQFLHPTVPSDVYFSFSTVINFAGPTVDKVVAALQSVPDDRILVESDLHCAGKRMDDLLEEVVRSVCSTKGWSLEDGMRQLADNWKRFVFG